MPIEKGFTLSQDDQLRRSVIQAIMCGKGLQFAEYPDINFAEYFASELARLQEFVELGLITLDQQQLTITPRGRLFVRAVAMVFDDFLSRATSATYSKLI